jgi:hypothetical protein
MNIMTRPRPFRAPGRRRGRAGDDSGARLRLRQVNVYLRHPSSSSPSSPLNPKCFHKYTIRMYEFHLEQKRGSG